MTHEILTDRLRLDPLGAVDAAPLHALWTDADVRRWLWDDETIAPERTAAVIAESARMFETEGYGLWGARLREEVVADGGSLIGFGGFWYFREPPELELLYGIAAPLWGQGLATELATAVLGFGIDRSGFREVRASTDAPNEASVRVLEKIGFAFERRAAARGLDTLHFRFVPGASQ